MSDAKPSFFDSITEQFVGLAGEFVQGGLRVSVKTNLGPELPVFDGESSGGLGSLLGIKAAVIVRGVDGNVITTYGDVPATDPIKVAVLAVLIGLLGFALVRGVLPRK